MSETSGFKLTASLGIISLVSGVLLSLGYEFSKPYVARNEKIAVEASVFTVLKGAVRSENLVLAEGGPRAAAEGEKAELYAGYREDGSLVGYAIPAAARGYADVVQVLYGYDPAVKKIIGMTVLKSNETPGLGDKIAKDAAFQENFRALDASEPARIETVKNGKKVQPCQIDGISGATVSSKAVGKALRESATAVLPKLPSPEPRP
jgi:electron transport complex protein RnfG